MRDNTTGLRNRSSQRTLANSLITLTQELSQTDVALENTYCILGGFSVTNNYCKLIINTTKALLIVYQCQL